VPDSTHQTDTMKVSRPGESGDSLVWVSGPTILTGRELFDRRIADGLDRLNSGHGKPTDRLAEDGGRSAGLDAAVVTHIITGWETWTGGLATRVVRPNRCPAPMAR